MNSPLELIPPTSYAHIEPFSQFDPQHVREFKRTFARAIDRTWVAYQPIFCFHRSALLGYEAMTLSDEPDLAAPADLADAAELLGRQDQLSLAIHEHIDSVMPRISTTEAIFLRLHANGTTPEHPLTELAPLARWSSRI